MTINSAVRLAPLEEPSLGLFVAPGADLLAPLDSPVVGRQIQSPVRVAILRLRQSLLAEQGADGAWRCGATLATATLAKQALLRSFFVHRIDSRTEDLVRAIQQRRLAVGGWAAEEHSAGPVDLSASILCYLAVKLSQGVDAMRELSSTRKIILEQGGIEAADAETRAWLALFSQVDGEVLKNDQLPKAIEQLNPGDLCTPSPLHGVAELSTQPSGRCEAEATKSDLLTEGLTRQSQPLWSYLAGRVTSEHASRLEQANLEAELDALTDLTANLGEAADVVVETAIAVKALLESGMRQEDEPIAAAMDWMLREAKSAEWGIDRAAVVLQTVEAWLDGTKHVSENLPPCLSVNQQNCVRSEQGGHEQRKCKALQLRDGIGERLASEERVPGGYRQTATEVTARRLLALITAGAELEETAILLAVNWLLAEQSEAGTWEDGDLKATALAVEALSAAGFASHSSVDGAVDYLLEAEENTSSSCPDDSEGFDSPLSQAALNRRCDLLRALSRWSIDAPAHPQRGGEVCLRLVGCDTL